MKIIYHHRTLGDGAEGIHIAEMVNAFRQLGHEVLLLGPGVKKKTGEEPTKKYAWMKKIFRGPTYEMIELAYNVFGYMTLCRAIREFKPDLIYDRYVTFNYSAVAAGRKYDLPVFLEVNAPLAYERDKEPDETLYMKKLAYMIERKVCSDSARTIVVSTPLKAYLVSVGVPENHIHILPNGVNMEKFFPRPKSSALMRELQVKNKDIVIGFVGILRPWHGIDILLEAFKDVSQDIADCKLLLVGDGPIRNDIERKINELELHGKLFITGRVPHEKVGNYVALFDIAVSPKATFYASPMKIIEYMAQAKAIVAPDMPNIRDLIRGGIDGALFQPGNVGSMAGVIRKLILDKPLREKMGQRALISVEKRLNWINNARFILQEYQQLKH